MSVYTEVTHKQLEQFLAIYDQGSLLEYSGIQDGIENTNYAVSTTAGSFILTVFESFSRVELAPFMALMQHLASRGIKCPNPLTSRSGILNCIQDKPAALFPRLLGSSKTQPTAKQIKGLGRQLAQIHLASQSISFNRLNPYNVLGCQNLSESLKPFLDSSTLKLIARELSFQQKNLNPALPSGVIHADLFPDNVLFDGEDIAILDFYNACNETFIIDIAITLNAWFYRQDSIDRRSLQNFLAGYHSVRAIEEAEMNYLPVALRLAALNFWLLRLKNKHFARAGQITQIKDPNVYRAILQNYREATALKYAMA